MVFHSYDPGREKQPFPSAGHIGDWSRTLCRGEKVRDLMPSGLILLRDVLVDLDEGGHHQDDVL